MQSWSGLPFHELCLWAPWYPHMIWGILNCPEHGTQELAETHSELSKVAVVVRAADLLLARTASSGCGQPILSHQELLVMRMLATDSFRASTGLYICQLRLSTVRGLPAVVQARSARPAAASEPLVSPAASAPPAPAVAPQVRSCNAVRLAECPVVCL